MGRDVLLKFLVQRRGFVALAVTFLFINDTAPHILSVEQILAGRLSQVVRRGTATP